MKMKKLILTGLILTFLAIVNILDVSATGTGSPVIYFNGGKYVEIIQGGNYVEQGVFGIDTDGNVITDYEVDGDVDVITPGQYVITYKVEDMNGNVTVDNRLVVVVPFGQTLATNPQDIFSVGQLINWGGDGADEITASTETSDGGFVVVVRVHTDDLDGTTGDYSSVTNNNNNLGGYSNVIIKYDSNYTISWAEVIGSSIDDRINAIAESGNNEFVFAGNSGRYNSTTYNTLTTYQGETILNTNGDENNQHGMDGILGKFTYSSGITMDWVRNVSVTGRAVTDNKMLNDVIVDDDGSIIVAGSIIEGAEGVFFQKYLSDGTYDNEYIDGNPHAYLGMTGKVLKLSSGYVLFMSPDVELYKKSNHTSPFGVQNNIARVIKTNDSFVVDWNVLIERMNINDYIVSNDGNLFIIGDDTYGNDVDATFQDTSGTNYNDPIFYDRQYSASILYKLDMSDGSFMNARFVGGENVTGGNDDNEIHEVYQDRAMGIVEDSNGDYIIFGKTRSEGGYHADSSNPYDDTYALWAVSFTDDTVNNLTTINSNILLASNKNSQYNSFLDLGNSYLVGYSTESQYGASLRDNDEYNDSTANDVFLVEMDLLNSNDVSFGQMQIEETVTLDEDMNITGVEDLIDNGPIEIDDDIDFIYNGSASVTYKFDETNFDHTIPGVYTVPYYIYDSEQNAISGDLIITLNDITAPTITFDDLEVEVGNNPDFLEGVTITDEGDSSLTINDIVIDEGEFDEDVIDDYEVTYTATDASGNTRVVTRDVEVVDEIGLEIKFDGDLIIEVGTLVPNYLEGVDLSGNRGVSVSLTDVSVNTAPVNVMEVGTYEIKYTVDNGEREGEARRFIRVVDTQGPIFEVNTDKDTTLPVESSVPNWLDFVTVTDNYDNNPEVTYNSNVVFHIVGDYLVAYTARDSEGNESYYQLEIKIGDSIAPTIELKGETELEVEVFGTYDEEGFNVNDNYNQEEDIEVEVVSELLYTGDTLDTTGTYRIKYTAIDASGNRSNTVERIVHVVDTVPPTIEGIEFMEAVRNEEINFLEGITVKDNYDNEIIITDEDITRVADLTKPNGNYIVTITARDAAGNTATYSYDLYIVNEDAQVSGYIMGAAVVILLGGGILMATRKH